MIPQASLCMIARDEEAKLQKCLNSVADLVHEIIVVDTGSVDRSKQLAKDFGAHVYNFPWIDDFSAARNDSLRHAKGNWVFWLDTDEWIDNENRVRLTNVFDNLNGRQDGYRMQQRSQSQAATGDGEAGTLIF